MAWGEWMCPTLGPEHHLMLERERRAIEGYDLQEARVMLRKMADLMLRQELSSAVRPGGLQSWSAGRL